MGIPADYCTQVDEGGSGRERCAGACLASCMIDTGWQSDAWALTVEVSDTHGFTDHGATSEQLIAAAGDYGFTGRKWTEWGEVEPAILNGEWVLALLHNAKLYPRSYPSGTGWNATHWLRIKGIQVGGDLVYAYDPLTYLWDSIGRLYQGPYLYTTESVREGIKATPYAEAGVILSRP